MLGGQLNECHKFRGKSKKLKSRIDQVIAKLKCTNLATLFRCIYLTYRTRYPLWYYGQFIIFGLFLPPELRLISMEELYTWSGSALVYVRRNLMIEGNFAAKRALHFLLRAQHWNGFSLICVASLLISREESPPLSTYMNSVNQRQKRCVLFRTVTNQWFQGELCCDKSNSEHWTNDKSGAILRTLALID